MLPDPESASTVADNLSDREFITEKMIEFVTLKRQFLDRLKSINEESEIFSSLLCEFQNNADTLYSDMLSAYGLVIEKEAN